MPFRILSIDGGGIRGILPAMILADLERRTGRPVAETFDLIAGTSTGGILALGLTRPGDDGRPAFEADDLVGLYEEDGPKIFSRSVWHRMRALGNFAEEKYPSEGIEEVLHRRFGRTLLSEALTTVLVTSYDIELRQPYFFKSHRARKDPRRDHLMSDAARATSAAPTYFEPARVPVEGPKRYRALVDGGVYANNPATCALVEALCEFETTADDIMVLSLGTGELTRPLPLDEVRGWGLARWAQPLLNVVFDGVSDTVDYQLASLLGERAGRQRYLRIQTTLERGNDDMDDAGATNLEMLKITAQRLIQEHASDLDSWAERLTTGDGGG